MSNDEIAPVIEDFQLSQKNIEAGGTIEVQVQVSDNVELTQLRLRIREAFSKSFEAWSEQRIEFITGTSFLGNYVFQLPDSVLSGFYELSLQVADERGNASVDSARVFTVFLKEFSPQIVNFQTNPPLLSDGSLQLIEGDTLIFAGIAQDDTLLREVEIELLSAAGAQLENLLYNLIPDTISMWSFTENSDSIFTSQFQGTPSSLILRVTDQQGHLLREEIPVSFIK